MANGQLWGLPLGADANVLAYNQPLLSAGQVAPQPFWSASAFDAACARLVRRDATGNLTQTGAMLQSVPFAIWLWQQGADVLSPDGKSTAFDGPAGVKALTWLVNDVNVNGGAAAQDRLVGLTTLTGGVQGVFTSGKLGLFPATFNSFVRLKQANPQMTFHLATLPTIDGGTPSTMADVIYAFSPEKSANPQPEATWQFVKWLATNPVAQAAFYRAGAIPASLPAQQASALASDPDAQIMLQALKVARNPQSIDWEPDVANQLNNAVQQALNGQSTVKQALDQANTQGTQTIQQNLRLSSPA
jgi:multiple sugar transport system substrate-binding protein